MKYLVDLELGEDPFEELVVEDRAREVLVTRGAIEESRGLRSSVMTGRVPSSESRSMSVWPISPLAPVRKTTGVRSTKPPCEGGPVGPAGNRLR